MQFLPEQEWQARAAAHRERVLQWTGPHRERTRRQAKHPVCDFLFSYYPFRPGQLEGWHPGLGQGMEGRLEAMGEGMHPAYRQGEAGVYADLRWLKPSRLEGVRWTLALLKGTRERGAAFGCFGLHEWAMVYKAEEVRHAVPLRVSGQEVAEVVESQVIRCTHFDAFRFFTPEARPLNRIQPERSRMPELEQAGCLHANMDLYKWAFKLTPYLPSELVADCFELAWAVREVDMRASPYDLRELGYEPIRVETPEGRAEFEQFQRGFAQWGAGLRERLIEGYESVCLASGLQSGGHW